MVWTPSIPVGFRGVDPINGLSGAEGSSRRLKKIGPRATALHYLPLCHAMTSYMYMHGMVTGAIKRRCQILEHSGLTQPVDDRRGRYAEVLSDVL